jgi:hypothetical protein
MPGWSVDLGSGFWRDIAKLLSKAARAVLARFAFDGACSRGGRGARSLPLPHSSCKEQTWFVVQVAKTCQGGDVPRKGHRPDPPAMRWSVFLPRPPPPVGPLHPLRPAPVPATNPSCRRACFHLAFQPIHLLSPPVTRTSQTLGAAHHLLQGSAEGAQIIISCPDMHAIPACWSASLSRAE